MFKKLLIASAVLAVSTSVAFAANYKGDYKGEAAPAPCPTYTYTTGPYIGLSVGDRTNYSGTPTTFKGIDGNLSVGYGAIWNDMFYLAGELFGLDTAKVKDFTNANKFGTVGAKSSWGVGASILPGLMITDHVLGYARLGAIRTRFNDQSTNKTGWQGGLGLQTNVYGNWDLRAEYVYTGYGNVSGIGNVSSDQANLGLVYKFV